MSVTYSIKLGKNTLCQILKKCLTGSPGHLPREKVVYKVFISLVYAQFLDKDEGNEMETALNHLNLML